MVSAMRLPRWIRAGAVVVALAMGCQNYRDQLERADTHYRAARYEAALANLEDLEPDWSRLDRVERVRYEYVRGMTHARLNQRADARHWLAMAREEARTAGPAALTDEMRQLLQRTLAEVDWVTNPGREEAPNTGAAGGTGDAGAGR